MAHLLSDEPKFNRIEKAVRELKIPGRLGFSIYFFSHEVFIGVQITPVEVQIRRLRTLPGKALFVPSED